MNKLVRRLISIALAGVLMSGMCLTASAFQFPQAYWPLQQEWANAVTANNPNQIVSVAQKLYDVLSPLGMCQEVCQAMQFQSVKASWACEIQGDIDGAITWAERQYAYSKWLTDNGVHDYSNDLMREGQTRLDYLRAAQNVTIYARTNSDPSPYQVGPRTGTWFGAAAEGTKTNGSATLVYLNFGDGTSLSYWLDYWQHNHDGFSQALNGGVIELAWNIQNQSTAGVQAFLNSDSYINETLQTIGTEMKNATVLLRVGAEMNNWDDSDPEVFKQAFRKVASAARAYGNIQMVFSPNDICNLKYTTDQFYPGDEYVDWVGMSTYHSTDFTDYTGGEGSYQMAYERYYDDSFYGIGIYDHDPIVTIKPIVELARAHNKPVMISECGFSYVNKQTNRDMTAYAADQLNFFYSYVNMVYPEVKAVFYFDVKYREGAYDYYLASSPALSSAYDTAIRENGAYLYDVNGSVTGWETLDKASLADRNTVLLATYASFPGKHTTTVKYYLDGTLLYSADKAPFYYTLDIGQMTPGTHTIQVEAEGGQFKVSSQSYTIQVGGGSVPETPQTANAMPTNDTLTVNGVVQNATVYKINDSNYFKIRDLAAVLNGTSKQFEVGYDAAASSVTATTGQSYTMAGGELAGAAPGNEIATVSNDVIYVNGAPTEAEVYKINGSNYFKLRDLGTALGFDVGWSPEEGMFINTEG